jgi:hypothetical protein
MSGCPMNNSWLKLDYLPRTVRSVIARSMSQPLGKSDGGNPPFHEVEDNSMKTMNWYALQQTVTRTGERSMPRTQAPQTGLKAPPTPNRTRQKGPHPATRCHDVDLATISP